MKTTIAVTSVVRWVAPALLGLALSVGAAPAAAEDRPYETAELDRLLAPIALYPDSVLSHVLIAATYPLEVVQAARWSRAHPDLAGEDAVAAVEERDWDPSVKALVAFPEVLARMDENLEWTEDLGAAFLAQEADVMDRVQHLRARAYDAGHLDSLEHVHVIREREYIYIEPAVRHVVHVPYYDPWFVYGSWWWPHYPPYCWRTWHGHAVSYYGSGFYWGVGFRVAPTFYFTTFYWPQRYVVVVHDHRATRPLYSGRHVVRHQAEVRRWRHDDRRYHPVSREERHAAPGTRPERRRPAGEAEPASRQERGARPADRPRRARPDASPAPERRERQPREQRHDEPAPPQGRLRPSKAPRQHERAPARSRAAQPAPESPAAGPAREARRAEPAPPARAGRAQAAERPEPRARREAAPRQEQERESRRQERGEARGAERSGGRGQARQGRGQGRSRE